MYVSSYYINYAYYNNIIILFSFLFNKCLLLVVTAINNRRVPFLCYLMLEYFSIKYNKCYEFNIPNSDDEKWE